MPQKLRYTGEDKDMTLDELDEFVQAARKAGAPGSRNIYAVLSTSGKIKEVEVTLGEDDDD